MRKKILLITGLWVAPGLTGCMHSYVFHDRPPVTQIQDEKPSGVPQSSDFDFVEYSVTSSVRYPIVRSMDLRRIPRSQDVNSIDDIPASTWYTPRLGAKTISPEELLRGPVEIGPPQIPLQVVKAKTKGNSPGFIIRDSRGKKYLLKFDPSDYPNLESTVNLIANRLFWGFGYNVPEDFLFTFSPSDLTRAEDSGVAQEDFDHVLTFAAMEDDGRYRVTASLLIEGTVLGPIPQRGTRKGDTHDLIPHENLRILRALRVFSAFLDHSGIRTDNSLDVYAGEEGKGHTIHYLLDFGETMGTHGVEKGRVWDGFEHLFSIHDTARNYLRFGFPERSWEKLEVDPDDPRGSFEKDAFRLSRWRETTQYMPIRHSRPDDDYWAAKILGALQPEHLDALLKAANHPDPDYIEYLRTTLWARRDIIFKEVFESVTPVESAGVQNGKILFENRGKKLLPGEDPVSYKIRFYNRGNRRVGKSVTLEESATEFQVPLDAELMKKAGDYLRIEVSSTRFGKKSARPAEFHVITNAQSGPRLAGVVH